MTILVTHVDYLVTNLRRLLLVFDAEVVPRYPKYTQGSMQCKSFLFRDQRASWLRQQWMLIQIAAQFLPEKYINVHQYIPLCSPKPEGGTNGCYPCACCFSGLGHVYILPLPGRAINLALQSPTSMCQLPMESTGMFGHSSSSCALAQDLPQVVLKQSH